MSTGDSLAQLHEQLLKRERTEADLKSILANKDAESARLRAEVNRLRHAFSKQDDLHEFQASEVQELQIQLQQAKRASMINERQAILQSSAPAASTAQGDIHRLRSELEASKAENARLEAELAKQTASAAARLAELQDNFTAKIADTRRLHREQVTAVEQSAQQQQQQQPQQLGTEGAQLRALQAEVASLKQQSVSQGSAVTTLEARLGAEQQAVARLTLQLEEARSGVERMQQQYAQEVEILKAGKAAAEAKAKQAEQQGQGSLADESLASMLSMMEGQLARLSDTIRAKDAELASREAELLALRHAVTSGCEERRELAVQLERAQARAALQQQQQAPQQQPQPGSVSPGSPPSHHQHHAHNHVGPGKPYRAGLISRPKFKA